MSDYITKRADGTTEAAIVGREPWWQGLDGKFATVTQEAQTAKEMLELAQLDWTVKEQEVYIQTMGEANLVQGFKPQFRHVPGKKAIVRQDTGEVFYIGGEGYTPLQNSEAFEFLDALVAQGEAVFTTAGSLKGGRVVWAQITLPDEIRIGDESLLDHLTLFNSHDGSLALTVKHCQTRTVCWNTMSANLRDSKGKVFKACHKRGIKARVSEAREVLDAHRAYNKILIMQAERLLNTGMSEEMVLEDSLRSYAIYELPTLSPGEYEGVDYEARMEQVIDAALEGAHTDHWDNELLPISPSQKLALTETLNLFHHGAGNKGETAWDYVNAVTEFIDHYRPINGKLDTLGDSSVVLKRMESSWIGEGDRIKQRAWDGALGLAGV